MLPLRARGFGVGDLAGFDDEALRTFLDPADGGVAPAELGLALHDHPHLADRVAGCLPPEARPQFEAGRRANADAAARHHAGRRVVGQLFWPLLYWLDPDAYLELIAGEDLPQAVVDSLPLVGRVVADLGAGGGRFTLAAATRAARVIAIDAVPALLTRLEARATACGLGNIETRRAGFRRLPLDDNSVDIAVFCSSLTQRGPHGGAGALAEAERVVRRGGQVAVIWPDNPEWLLARGFSLMTTVADRVVHFTDPAAAERICRAFYGESAAAWVRAHHTAAVPFHVIGRPPTGIACLRPVR